MPIDNPDYQAIQEEGVLVKRRTAVNFIGATLTAVDDPTNNRVNVTSSAGGGGVPDAHKDSHDPEDGSDPLDTAGPAALLEVQGQATGVSHSLARADHAHAIVHDITDNSLPTIDGTTNAPVDNDFAKFTASGLEGRSYAETLTDIFSATLPEDVVIILDALLSADEHWSGIAEIGTVGYGATVGDLVYLDGVAGNNKWELAKADVAATSKGKLGLILATTSEDATCNILLYGKMRSAAFPALTVGAPVHVSAATAGDMAVAAPTGTTNFVVRIIGYGNTAEDLLFCPDNSYVELV